MYSKGLPPSHSLLQLSPCLGGDCAGPLPSAGSTGPGEESGAWMSSEGYNFSVHAMVVSNETHMKKAFCSTVVRACGHA